VALGASGADFLLWRQHLEWSLGRKLEPVDHELSWSLYFEARRQSVRAHLVRTRRNKSEPPWFRRLILHRADGPKTASRPLARRSGRTLRRTAALGQHSGETRSPLWVGSFHWHHQLADVRQLQPTNSVARSAAL
jgi:hypothetical protein